MKAFNFEYDKKESKYTCFSNIENQTVEVCFTEYTNDIKRKTYWFISAIIYNKRKNKSMLYENTISSGNFGIKGLIVIKNIILNFEDFIKNRHTNKEHFLIIYGSDSKRRRIYKESLKRIGFSYGLIGGYLQNYKKII